MAARSRLVCTVGTTIAITVTLLTTGAPAGAVVADGLVDSVLSAAQTRPPEQSSAGLDGLEYGDPGAGVDLIEAPEPGPDGAARMSYPIEVPPGRQGVQPDLSIEYDSRSGNGWLGVGWDLAVPAVTVDTTWGVPRYRRKLESETYLLDGAQLWPTSHREQQLPRKPDRVFHKRIESDFLQITRHGDSPRNYWWEVGDKAGNRRFFGGTPEAGFDPDHVLTDADGNIYSWSLTQIRDISSNVADFHYDRVFDTGVGNGRQDDAPRGQELYLSRITYAGSVLEGQDRTGPYEVRFIRDSRLPDYDRRPDPVIDARTGALRVTAEVLRHIRISYQDKLTRRYDLAYRTGAFGKLVLASISQAGTDGEVFATHTFDYFDDVRRDGRFHGFEEPATWHTGSDKVGVNLFGRRYASAMGGAVKESGDGRLYLGFNLAEPEKNGSAGGGLAMDGSSGRALLQAIDLNGDNLPDKVFVKDGRRQYRLNRSGPDGGTTYSAPVELPTLPGLSRDSDFSVSAGPEAYFVAGAMYHHQWSYAQAEAYFTDVNADGLPDYVDHGQVWFNHLDSNGVPTFNADSRRTARPVPDADMDRSVVEDFDQDVRAQRQRFPVQDTVRRWVVPWTGTISIDAPVHVAGDSVDGVRVAIQHNNTELWSAVIPGGDRHARVPTGVDRIAVSRGDRIYFRLQPREDSTGDRVAWDPVIGYPDEPVVIGVNGLNAYRYQAGRDFTLGGRPGIGVGMPLDGEVRLAGAVTKSAVTTDDIRVLVSRNDTVVAEQTIGAEATGTFRVDKEFPVRGPSRNGEGEGGEGGGGTGKDGTTGKDRSDGDPSGEAGQPGDRVTLRLAVDSPIDAAALSWDPELYYISATRDGRKVPTHNADGEPINHLHPPYDLDLYPSSDLTRPQRPWRPESGGPVELAVRVRADAEDGAFPADVVFTVKTRDRLVVKRRFHFTEPGVRTESVNVDVEEGTGYFLDFSTREPRLGPELSTSARIEEDQDDDTEDAFLPHAVHWSDPPGIFPQAYRGWGYAGYNGSGDRASEPIDEEALRFQLDDYPEEPPTGFDDPDYRNPVLGGSYAYAPDPRQHRWQGPGAAWEASKGRTWGSADGASAARLGPDEIPVPTAAELIPGRPHTRAPIKLGRGDSDAVAANFFGAVGGSVAWGRSTGVLDYLDLNGDAYPDVAGHGRVQFTSQFGDLDPEATSVPRLDVVRADRTVTKTLQGSGAPAKVKLTPSGGGNKDQPAGGTVDPGVGAVGDDSGGESDAAAGGSGSGGEADAGGGDGAGRQASTSEAGVDLGFTLSANLDLGWTETNTTGGINAPYPGDTVQTALADLNGDGLADRIRVLKNGDIKVAFNLGYRFTSAESTWPPGSLEQGSSESVSLGIGVGFNASGNFDFTGGASFSSDTSRTDTTWSDVNGDGLPDRLDRSGGGVGVSFNTGAGLTGAVDFGDFQDGDVAASESIAAGGGADFSLFIGPLCFPTDLCYIIVNPGGHGAKSLTRPRVELVDVNGDGYADSVYGDSDGDGRMSVALNTTGRTGLLRSVRRPLGATIELDYVRDGNTTSQPYSRWNLHKVEVHDGHDGDGADVALTTYEYRDPGPWDPRERDIYGYRTVLEEQHDTTQAGDPVYRTWERVYRQDSWYTKGLLTRQVLHKGTVEDRPIRSTENTYHVVVPGTTEPAHLTSVSGSAFAQLISTVERWYDTSGTPRKSRTTDYAYDLHGNTVEVDDLGEPDTPGDDVRVDIGYTDCFHFGAGTNDPTAFNWTQLPNSLVARNGERVLRRRDADVPCDFGAVTQLREYLEPDGDQPGTVAVTDVEYAPVGNVLATVGPRNAEGDRYRTDYAYDEATSTHVVSSTDSFDLTTRRTWDLRLGLLASETSPARARTSLAYDPQGRLVRVTGPFQQPQRQPRRQARRLRGKASQGSARDAAQATIRFEYHLDDRPAWVLAKHVDTLHPDDPIETVAFADGLNRQVQTKTDATVFRGAGHEPADRMVVSGSTYWDAFGRPVRQYYPVTEPLGTPGVYNRKDDSVPPERTTYRVTDQVLTVTRPDGVVLTTTYGFGGPLTSSPALFKVTRTDALERRTVTYSDVRSNIVAKERFHQVPAKDVSQTRTIRTRFDYDPLQQLIRIVDDSGATTTLEYDLLGRRTAVEQPDAGLHTSAYDLASNLTSTVSPTQRSAGTETAYSYDHNRLTDIGYPRRADDVHYTYGPAGTGDQAGQVVRVEDAARIQTRKYDALGNVIEESTDMKATPVPRTDKTGFVYDTWGRLLTMTYPDGERLGYGYDSGGLPNSVSGVKDEKEYAYVDRFEYDKFGNVRYREFGNGVTSVLGYSRKLLRLAGQRVRSDERELQHLSYHYDKVGNVLERRDSVPLAPEPHVEAPSVQTYRYDDLDRLVHAEGRYSLPRVPPFFGDDRREYTLDLEYGDAGRLRRKKQKDVLILPPAPPVPVSRTTYDLDYRYENDHTDSPVKVGGRTWHWNANGEFTGWFRALPTSTRSVRWTDNGRIRSITDPTSSTSYRYDDTGALGVGIGPDGATEFVNRWYTVFDGTVGYKHIWLGDERIATKRVHEELRESPFFYGTDLLGSVNLVTNPHGRLVEHVEYLPSGEIWLRRDRNLDLGAPEHLFAGRYWARLHDLYLFGARWYDPRHSLLYSPDPTLVETPAAVIDDPRLLHAYTYAYDNPTSLVDVPGLAPTNPLARLHTVFAPVGAAARTRLGALGESVRQRGQAIGQGHVRPITALEESPAFQKTTKVLGFSLPPVLELDLGYSREGLTPQAVRLFGSKVFTATPAAPAAAAPGTEASGPDRPGPSVPSGPSSPSSPSGLSGPSGSADLSVPSTSMKQRRSRSGPIEPSGGPGP